MLNSTHSPTKTDIWYKFIFVHSPVNLFYGDMSVDILVNSEV